MTGASVQVASEMLPNSTERAVTISGGSEAITQCIYNICNIMAEVRGGREGGREGKGWMIISSTISLPLVMAG